MDDTERDTLLHELALALSYKLIEATGYTAEATKHLLAWLHDRADEGRCRCCGQGRGETAWEGHDATMPCGELRDAIKDLGEAVHGPGRSLAQREATLMASKQFDHLQESSAQRLRALVPSSCPLLVSRAPSGGFRACTLDGRDEIIGRFQVVSAWLAGYISAWRRLSRVDAVSRTSL